MTFCGERLNENQSKITPTSWSLFRSAKVKALNIPLVNHRGHPRFLGVVCRVIPFGHSLLALVRNSKRVMGSIPSFDWPFCVRELSSLLQFPLGSPVFPHF